MARRPGGELSARPLHFIWLADCSSSMLTDGKIQKLNQAIREAVPHMQEVARDNPNAEVLVRAISFSTGAKWHISSPTPVEDFEWNDLTAEGVTDMGKAISLLTNELKIPPMTDRGLPPVLVMVSDGMPTDDFVTALKKFQAERWGQKAVKIAIAIGMDADLDCLQQFINNGEVQPLVATNAPSLVNYIRWASTAVLKSASAPPSQQSCDGTVSTSNIPIPEPPQSDDSPDVW